MIKLWVSFLSLILLYIIIFWATQYDQFVSDIIRGQHTQADSVFKIQYQKPLILAVLLPVLLLSYKFNKSIFWVLSIIFSTWLLRDNTMTLIELSFNSEMKEKNTSTALILSYIFFLTKALIAVIYTFYFLTKKNLKKYIPSITHKITGLAIICVIYLLSTSSYWKYIFTLFNEYTTHLNTITDNNELYLRSLISIAIASILFIIVQFKLLNHKIVQREGNAHA